MAGNELLEVLWGGAIEATVSKRQNFVIDALIHRQPVKSSPDRFDMLCHFFVRVTVLAAVLWTS